MMQPTLTLRWLALTSVLFTLVALTWIIMDPSVAEALPAAG